MRGPSGALGLYGGRGLEIHGTSVAWGGPSVAPLAILGMLLCIPEGPLGEPWAASEGLGAQVKPRSLFVSKAPFQNPLF